MTHNPRTTLVLMPCGGSKLDHEARLYELYTGPMWSTLRQHIGAVPIANVFVLSAELGFVSAYCRSAPYDKRLTETAAERMVQDGIFYTGNGNHVSPRAAIGFTVYETVIIAGAGYYRRVLEAFVRQFQGAGAVTRNATIITVDGGIGEQRSQLGEALRLVNIPPAPASELEHQAPAGELAVTNARNVDEKTIAERAWRAPLKPRAEQRACDLGLFSDDSKQTEMF